ncbi:MAG: hypothetical protein R2939_09450 [Kofleriaceae bacterium]
MKLVEKGRTLDALVARRPRRGGAALYCRTSAVPTRWLPDLRGFLHRDLKPANVMVGAFGETAVIRLGPGERVDDVGPTNLPTGDGAAGSALATRAGARVARHAGVHGGAGRRRGIDARRRVRAGRDAPPPAPRRPDPCDVERQSG